RLRTLAQPPRVMVEGRGEINGVLALVGRREADHLGIIFGLLVDVGHFVNGVGDLLDADHVGPPLLFPVETQALGRASAPMTSTMAAASFSPKPMSMNLS